MAAPIVPQVSHALEILDFFGITVFAISGALVAAEKRQTLVTFIFFAVVTGVGGGTLRDLLIGVPVFWVHRSGYIYVCLAAAGAVWLLGEQRWRSSALAWFDAVGLAAYAVLGAAKALGVGVSPPVAVVMGALTATFGGIMRDLIAGQPSVLLKREIYITAAVLAATVFVAATTLGLEANIAAVVGFVAGFGLRAGAIAFGWTLPGFART